MRTLHYKFNNNGNQANTSIKSKEEIVDTIFCLVSAAIDDKLTCAGPERISITVDGNVMIDNPEILDLYYAAPELVLCEANKATSSKLFTVGLLAYFILIGKEFYEDKHMDVINMKELKGNGNGLIALKEEDLFDGSEVITDLVAAVNKFTAWNQDEREKGIPCVLRAIDKCLTVADVKYCVDNKVVHAEMMQVSDHKYVIDQGTKISGRDGKAYVVTEKIEIIKRAGRHTYKIPVKEVI